MCRFGADGLEIGFVRDSTLLITVVKEFRENHCGEGLPNFSEFAGS